ncbi:D-glycero-beta-D-manno-heptose 1,7-bisphosphate 7-phosphatase [Laribacter hongkongensis]|jgi:D-glycero-D-manno-heptose 1,7-bisphosphate phosphatase|uniref:D,D-heptose 1,7-bisphosphate phosphatase n=1 Tax=Laribacter hongkongensis TaxID=168471 RepID=A0A248LH85_9NEIS|nr:D-glycero-beta-D-manno-heptose 1,7-bisphosphate 7-phosphatase [Laribacter hongkongensis]MBP9527729.1 D-glycero-beta-D-manno-heptose 1,7-bisphosphate 7-phosphatase [Laribacter sp.]ASJ23573.1 D,D-heptose 1,7-bisphosphate phosphatase [Laribacter hongkongensis]MBE5530086.1 D-glycero-beta-D-manno-heptose-1,7-bisphosphate 7-phosphatase [Laribacter hongkongensis]MBP9608199.1 D-glycero-beta-D-manno-heptose 1,7-bisphosphate 7-phosphatase [Laribacter sp.]MCG8992026.1 D-glycero-beta-D-manno-heptose 1,
MKIVILDRDGVINHDRDDFVKNSLEWVPLPKAAEAIALFSQAGWRVVVATNQSGIGRGLFDMHALNAMHEKMHHLISKAGGRIDAVFFCPHKPEAGCSCRKPAPGMVLEVAERFSVKPESLWLVGDSLRDLEAVAAVGGRAILVRTGKGRKTEAAGNLPAGTPVFDDLHAAAEWLISLES